MYCNFCNLKYSVYRIYILHAFTSDCLCICMIVFILLSHQVLNTWSACLVHEKPAQNITAFVSRKAGYYEHGGCDLKFSSVKIKNFQLLCQNTRHNYWSVYQQLSQKKRQTGKCIEIGLTLVVYFKNWLFIYQLCVCKTNHVLKNMSHHRWCVWVI